MPSNRSDFLRLHVLCPVLLLALAAVLGACGGDSPTDVHSSPPSLSTLCLTAGTQVSCTASFFTGTSGPHDVTADATWLASDPSVGVFVRPGVFSPAKRGEVEISASYRGVQTHVASRFLVDPLKTPQYLQFLSGIIYDDLTGTPLAGATVEILSGYSQGARSTSNEYGYYHFDTMLAGETFSARASNPGYATVTTSYRVDPSVTFSGDPNNSPFLDFRLHPLE
jgi:hypothetical protein